jgi:hypothetical protein
VGMGGAENAQQVPLGRHCDAQPDPSVPTPTLTHSHPLTPRANGVGGSRRRVAERVPRSRGARAPPPSSLFRWMSHTRFSHAAPHSAHCHTPEPPIWRDTEQRTSPQHARGEMWGLG